MDRGEMRPAGLRPAPRGVLGPRRRTLRPRTHFDRPGRADRPGRWAAVLGHLQAISRRHRFRVDTAGRTHAFCRRVVLLRLAAPRGARHAALCVEVHRVPVPPLGRLRPPPRPSVTSPSLPLTRTSVQLVSERNKMG